MHLHSEKDPEDLRAITEMAQALLPGEHAQAFQLGVQTFVAVRGVLLFLDEDSDSFYFVSRLAVSKGGHPDFDLEYALAVTTSEALTWILEHFDAAEEAGVPLSELLDQSGL